MRLAGACHPAEDAQLAELGQRKRIKADRRAWARHILARHRTRRYVIYGLGLWGMYVWTGLPYYPVPATVLLCLAVSPGSTDERAGLVRDQADFRQFREDLLDVTAALCKRYGSRVGFLGIEVADDPVVQRRHGLSVTEGIALHALRNYYREAYDVVRYHAGEEALVVIPDAGHPRAWRSFMAQDRYRNVWLDCHLFHHTAHVDAAGPSAVRTLVDRSRAYLDRARRSGLPTMVGKWSASLPYADAMMTPEGQIALARVYVSEQLSAFASCPGWFFQTWKTSGRLVGWDARVALATFERRMLD